MTAGPPIPRFRSSAKVIYDKQIRANDDRARQNRNMKFEAVSDHASQQCDVCAPLRLRQSLRGNRQQPRDQETHQNARRGVPPYERFEISFDQKPHARCIDQYERLADEVEEALSFGLLFRGAALVMLVVAQGCLSISARAE